MTIRGARYPSLFQINTRVWLTELARRLGRAVTLDDIPEQELDRLASRGFDWIWLLSVWQTGAAGRRVSRTNQEWQAEFRDTLPICAKKTSRDRGSRLPATRSTRCSAATRRWPACAPGCCSAVSV